jgi:excisionase family DNA binding protein
MAKLTSHSKHATAALSIEEAAARTGLGRVTLYRSIRKGDLVARKAGRRTVILEADLAAYLSALPMIAPKAAQHGR